MSSQVPADPNQTMYAETELISDPAPAGALPWLLQPDPEAVITVELVDHPLELPQDQFDALLADSECEV